MSTGRIEDSSFAGIEEGAVDEGDAAFVGDVQRRYTLVQTGFAESRDDGQDEFDKFLLRRTQAECLTSSTMNSE